MKKRFKTFIMMIMLAGVMFIFSGCAYYNTSFSVESDVDYMGDKYVDLLIPINENDESYTEYNDFYARTGSMKTLHIPENSEIVTYNKDGYRSTLMHLKGSFADRSLRDSENNADYHEDYNGVPAKIIHSIILPDKKYSMDEDMFTEFCDKYKYYRVAVFDGEGNIIHISERMPMKLLGYYTYCDIEYDPENNTIRQDYIPSVDLLIFLLLLILLSIIFAVVSLLLLIVFECRYRERDRSCIKYVVFSACMNIPMLIVILWDLLVSVFGSASVKFAVFAFLGGFTVIPLISYIITAGVFIIFCIINHKMKDPFYVY